MSSSLIPPDHPLQHRTYFFDNGVCFECLQCGKCCTGEPGIVRVTEEEVSAIARFLSLSIPEFQSDYLQIHDGKFTVREERDGRCLFYDKNCRIYPVRPRQCRTFPFWLKNFRSEKGFQGLLKECPGLGEGRLFTKEEILSIITTP